MTFWLHNWNSASEHQNVCERVWRNFACSRYKQVTPSHMFCSYCLMTLQIVISETFHDEVTSRAFTALILQSFNTDRWNPSQMVSHHYLQDRETIITEHLWWSHLFVSNNRRVMAVHALEDFLMKCLVILSARSGDCTTQHLQWSHLSVLNKLWLFML